MPATNERRLCSAHRLAVLFAVFAATIALPAAAMAQSRSERLASGIVKRLNAIRADHGLSALRRDRGLTEAAEVHSDQMLRDRYFAHESPSGAPFFTRVRRWVSAGRLGETIAWSSGRPRPATVVRAWMHSPSHRATLLTGAFRRVGVASSSGRLFGRHGVVVTADLAG